jgi:hypothetical protein
MFARVALIALAASMLAGCASFDVAKLATAQLSESLPTWRGLPVAPGQLVFIEKPGAGSLFLSLASETFEPFIHVGIVDVENGKPYVYEAFGLILPRLSGAPNEGMRGGVRRVTLRSFLRRDGIIVLQEPPDGVDRTALVEFARARWRDKTPFDGHFDARDASRYYCVEFVTRALEAAGARRLAGRPLTTNRSMRTALDWLRIDAPELLLAGQWIDEERRVARLSRRLTAGEIDAYFERKREVHRRFTHERRLGAVFEWRRGPRLRPAVKRFFDTGRWPAKSPDPLKVTVAGNAH